MTQVVQDRFPLLRKPRTDRLPQQILICNIRFNPRPKFQPHNAAPDFGRRSKRARRNVKELLSLAVSLNQNRDKSTVRRPGPREYSLNNFALKHQYHLLETGALRNQSLQDRG